MQMVFGQLNDFGFCCIDDVLVHDASKHDHLEHLKLISQKIREAGFQLKLSKCAVLKRHQQCLINFGCRYISFERKA